MKQIEMSAQASIEPEPETPVSTTTAAAPDRPEPLIEAEPFWSSSGRLRRRPPVYGVSSIVLAIAALRWGEPRALWMALTLAVIAAVAIARTPAPETVLTYSSDIGALAAGIVYLGLVPTAGLALWSAIVVVAFFGLPRREARLVLVATVVAITITFVGDGRWAALDLSEAGRFAVSVALTVIGFGYLATVVPSLAEATRHALWSAEEATEAQRHQADFRAHLASTVAHELRNPLAGVRGFVDVLASEADRLSSAERDEYLSIVASQTASLEGIVEDLLVAVQHEGNRVSVDEVDFDAAAVVTRTVREMGPGVGELVVIDAAVPTMAVGDPVRVGQIVRNLVSNAHKYGGPTVRVSCAVVEAMVRIEVSDDGPGIAPHDVARMFERFEGSAKGSVGYGLGLPISRQLAHAMGGDLAYESGGGASFVLTLPQARPRA